MKDEKYKDKPWYGKISMAGKVQEQYDAMTPEQQQEFDEALVKIAENPRRSEPSHPCAICGQYFWYSDGQCPSCGWRPLH